MGLEGLPYPPEDELADDDATEDEADDGGADLQLVPGAQPDAPPPMDAADPDIFEPMDRDHPLYGMDIDGLTQSDRQWIQDQFLHFYSESTRENLDSKFGKFEDFCHHAGLAAFPAHPSTVYKYIRFLREEGRVGVRSSPQYLAAISMVHQSRGMLSFSAFDAVTRRLIEAWRKGEPSDDLQHTPVHVDTWQRILQLALSTGDPRTLRSCLSALLDFVFYNRAVSGHLILPGDLRVEDDVIIFRERATKTHRTQDPGHQLRTFRCNGVPQLQHVVLRWEQHLRAAWQPTGIAPSHFWTLPGERRPAAKTISTWFSHLLAAHPDLAPIPHRHHDLRAGGATACFALEMPESRIRAWGNWADHGRAFWRYIDIDRQPTEWDFRLFGWMTIRATDLHARYAHIFL